MSEINLNNSSLSFGSLTSSTYFLTCSCSSLKMILVWTVVSVTDVYNPTSYFLNVSHFHPEYEMLTLWLVQLTFTCCLQVRLRILKLQRIKRELFPQIWCSYWYLKDYLAWSTFRRQHCNGKRLTQLTTLNLFGLMSPLALQCDRRNTSQELMK